MPGNRLPKKPRPSTKGQIKSNELVIRLQHHAFTHPGKRNFKSQYMQPSQVTAAIALLKKTIPDLASHTIETDQPITVEVLQVAKHKTAK